MASITSFRTTTAAARAAAGAVCATGTRAICLFTFLSAPMITTGVQAAVSRTFLTTARRRASFPERPDRTDRGPRVCGGLWFAAVGFTILAGAPALAYEPRINYMLQCLGCHGPDGRGEPGHVPSIRSTLVPLSQFAAGRRYLLQVPGVALSMLSDADLASLLNWMIPAFGGVPPKRFRAFTAAEVTRYRREPLVEISATRARLMRQMQLHQ